VTLFETWYARLVTSMRRRLHDADDAEDVVQEAFVRLLDETPKDPPAWLFTVAGRLATDRRRAAKRRGRLALHRADDLAPSPAGDSAERQLERAETVETVRAILAELPERDRQLLLLHHDGLSYREIAARLDLSSSSVGSLLTRAHRRFLAAHDARSTGVRASRSALP
jgi:RNA polymerase sigma-70 factor (ECF subfamily)